MSGSRKARCSQGCRAGNAREQAGTGSARTAWELGLGFALGGSLVCFDGCLGIAYGLMGLAQAEGRIAGAAGAIIVRVVRATRELGAS